MTVCIAAVCQHEDVPQIILCNDYKKTSGLGSAETEDKFHSLKFGWYALGAGTKSQIEFLVREYRNHLRGISEITDMNIAEVLREPLVKRKRALATEYIQNQYGLSYDEFLSIGREKLPPDMFRNELEYVKRIWLDAALIIVGFTGGDPKTKSPNICKVESDGTMSLQEDFAVIGQGELLASPIFYQRAYTSKTPLSKAIFYVSEAKKNAENLASVGEDTSLDILGADNVVRSVNDAGFKALGSLYRKYHPELHMSDFKYDDSHFIKLTITD